MMLANKNTKTLIWLILLVGLMVGVSFAAVPLYDLFCRVTGFGGTTSVSTSYDNDGVPILEKTIRVRFDGNVNKDLSWEFYPQDTVVTLPIGKLKTIYYVAKNLGDNANVGTATFNVTPHKVGQYFIKTQCFCFNEQALNVGEDVRMPVIFYVDPEFVNDTTMDDVQEITLSYTFFNANGKDI